MFRFSLQPVWNLINIYFYEPTIKFRLNFAHKNQMIESKVDELKETHIENT